MWVICSGSSACNITSSMMWEFLYVWQYLLSRQSHVRKSGTYFCRDTEHILLSIVYTRIIQCTVYTRTP